MQFPEHVNAEDSFHSLQQQPDIQQLQQQISFLQSMLQGQNRIKLNPEKPPTYSGDGKEGKDSKSMELRPWTQAVRHYFGFIESGGTFLTDYQKIQFVGQLLRGPAADWYYMSTDPSRAGQHLFRPITTLEDLLSELCRRFEPVNANETNREKLAHLKQTNSVAEYVRAFLALASKITDLSPAESKDRFMRGLKLEVRRYITPFNPEDVARAAEIAGQYDVPTGNHSGALTSGPVPMDIDAMVATLNALGFKPQKDRRQIVPMGDERRKTAPSKNGYMEKGRWLTEIRKKYNLDKNEMTRLIAERRCLACKELGHVLAQCPKKQE